MIEGLLEGKNFFVTGGSRDIGASIVSHLLESGANVGFCFYHPGQEKYIHSRPGLSYILADLKSPEDRKKISDFIDQTFDGRLDGLVLNASDSSLELNVVANLSLVNKFLQLRRNQLEADKSIGEASLVLMQSVPGHFYDRLGSTDLIPRFYRPIAKAKNQGESKLKERRVSKQLSESGINFFIVCPPAVIDTTNWIQFKKRRDPEIDIKHKKITDTLGLPEKVSKDDVGRKVTELLINPPKQGHLEYFNDTLDSKVALSRVYGLSLRLPDTYNVEQKTAWMIVTRRHCRDHFIDRPILPGFLIEETAAQVAVLLACQGNFEQELPILKGRSVEEFKNPVLPGDFLKFQLEDYETSRKRDFMSKIRITKNDGVEVADVFVRGALIPKRFIK